MDGRTIGIIGGIVGSALGILGGLFGTYCSIKNTRTPAERTFMVRASIGMWAVMILLVGLPLVLAIVGVIPRWFYWVAFGLFFVLLGPSIVWLNKKQAALREEAPSDRQK